MWYEGAASSVGVDMHFLKYCGGALIAALVVACGSENSAESKTPHSIATPKVNSQQIYSHTSTNSTDYRTSVTVTSVNADGSFVTVRDYLTGNSPSLTSLLNNSRQELSYSTTSPNGAPLACTITPHGSGPDYPLAVGQTWSQNYVITCGTVTISYTDTGVAMGIESVTVPAGTFSTVKLQDTLIITRPNGAKLTNTLTSWRDMNTGVPIKGGNTIENSEGVTTTSVLESQL
jgi:hypothetical protein